MNLRRPTLSRSLRPSLSSSGSAETYRRTAHRKGARLRLIHSRPALQGLAATLSLCMLLLTGCGVALEDTDVITTIPGRTIHGNVHGGVYPIRNATVKLMQTQTGPYTGKAAIGTAYTGTSTYGSAATMLLQTNSDQNGYFTFPDTGWTCTSNEFAYIVVTSGTTSNLATTNDNNNVVQVGVIGPCSELATQTDIDDVEVFVSELSTVAAAYSLGNFMSIVDPNDGTGDQIVNIGAPLNNSITGACTGAGSNQVCTAAGLAHAFANAADIVSSVSTNGVLPTGQANNANPHSNVSAVPAAMINTIGNILQQCVDSIGGTGTGATTSSQCTSLFSAATPPGGVAPTNTLQVALNMAKYPTNNISALFQLEAPAVPFTPTLDQAPTSFTVSIFYGATASGSYVPYPVDLALDASDSIYVLYGSAAGASNTYGGVFALYASGAQLFYGAHNTSILYPSQIALASGGRVYVTNDDPVTPANGGLYATNTSNNNGTLTLQASLNYASGVAVDQTNNVWVSNASNSGASVVEFLKATINASTGAAIPDYSSGALTVPVQGLAIDAGQDIWGVSPGAAPVTSTNSSGVVTTTKASVSSITAVIPNTGTAKTPAYAVTGTVPIKGTLSGYNGFSVAISSSSTAFVPLYDQLNSAVSSGSAVTTTGNPSMTTSSASNVATTPHRSEVDGAGNVFWTDNEYTGLLWRYTPGTGTSSGSLISLLPCFPFPTSNGLQCITTNNSSSAYTPSNLRALAIDSAGDVWYAADAGYGAVIETLGLAAPTWPELSYGYPGCMPDAATMTPKCP